MPLAPPVPPKRRAAAEQHLKLRLAPDAAVTSAAPCVTRFAPQLTYLDLNYNPIGDEGAVAISTLGNLQRLDLTRTGLNSLGVSALRQLTRLEELVVGRNSPVEEGVRALASLQRLRKLEIFACDVSADGAAALAAGLTALTCLHIEDNPLFYNGLAALSALTNLRQLVAKGCLWRPGSLFPPGAPLLFTNMPLLQVWW